MLWLTKFIQRGGDLKGAIREFTRMNGRMPRTSEMNKMLQAFGAKGDLRGWTPRIVEGGQSPKEWTDKSGTKWIQRGDDKPIMISEGIGFLDTPYKRMKFEADVKRAIEAKQKTGLKEFTKKEDAYEKASILKDKAKTGLPEFDEILEQEFAKSFPKGKKEGVENLFKETKKVDLPEGVNWKDTPLQVNPKVESFYDDLVNNAYKEAEETGRDVKTIIEETIDYKFTGNETGKEI